MVTLVTNVARRRQRAREACQLQGIAVPCLSQRGVITIGRVGIVVIIAWHAGPIFLEERDGGCIALAEAQVNT